MSDSAASQLRESLRGDSPQESPGNPSSASAPGDAERLTSELKKKDHLIAALTEHLEQAAEQLDRASRFGDARGAKRTASGIPTELLAEHQAVVTDLREIAGRWQAFQGDIVLERIEQQVLELRDLVADRLSPSEDGGGQRGRSAGVFPLNDRDAATGTGTGTVGAAIASDTASMSRSHESFPLGASADQPRPASSSPILVPTGDNAPSASNGDQPVDLPAPVPFDSLTLDDAIAGICDRDQCILKLREKLALQTGSTENGDAPEAIPDRLAELEEIWREKFRQHELSLSLERARLAREAAELRQNQERLMRELDRYNLAKGSGVAAQSAAAKENAKRSRWMRFLGNGKNSGKGADS